MKNFLIIFLLLPVLVMSQSNFERGQRLFEEGKTDQAEIVFKSILKSEPSNLKVVEYLGDIAGINKSWDEALSYYEKLKIARPTEADYFYKYGGALGMKALEVNKFKALGMIDDVKGSFEKAIKLDPKHLEARWALIELYLKLPGIVGGSESKAIRYSAELMRLSPVDGNLSRGHIEEYFKRYSKAEQYYKKAIAIGNSKVSYQKLADLYKNKMNNPEKASETLLQYKNSGSAGKKNI
jgi:tetratricopeptide (TPR) repeat protein|tara:strand:- start:101 stop:814 length:714 start_codon:yes stop_codon:yes gene_type:complete